jgi:hypothetical protein
MNQTKNRTAPFSLPNVERSHSVLKKVEWSHVVLIRYLEPNRP